MVFRLPSHQLQSLVPAPATQHNQEQDSPWRGTLFVTGLRDSDRNNGVPISVVAVETDGEKMQQWPSVFEFQVLHDHPVQQQFIAWLRSCLPPLPMCTFLPDKPRSGDPAVNTANFRNLSTLLHSRGLIAFAHWPTNSMFTGAGIIIYPASNSSVMLVGSLFFIDAFPEFLGISHPSSPISPMSHSVMPSSRHPDYQHRIVTSSPYGSSPQHRHAHSLSPHGSNPNSPTEQPISGHGRVSSGYNRFMMSRPGPSNYPPMNPLTSPSDPAAWPNVKAEDENGYATYSPNHDNPPYT